MATHSSILVWEIPWTEELAWWASVHGVAKDSSRLSNRTTTIIFQSIHIVLVHHHFHFEYYLAGS